MQRSAHPTNDLPLVESGYHEEMLKRDLSRFDKVNSYPNLEAFYQEHPQVELSTIKYGDGDLDVFFLDRGASTTVICFHAALATNRTTSYPLFSALRMTSHLDANIICISDPILERGLSLGWYAGADKQPLQRDLPNVIRHILSVYDKHQHLVFMGASGGGFAALFYSHGFPGSSALAMNAQTNISEYTESAVSEYLNKAWGVGTIQEAPITFDLTEVYRDGFPNKVYFMQNLHDSHHRDRHIAHWMRGIPAHSPNMNLLMGDWGFGHVPPPADLVQASLEAIVERDQDQLDRLGFINKPARNEPAKQVMAHRALSND